MLLKALSISVYGLEVLGITIETYVSNRGFPSFDIVGLAGKEVAESKQRVLAALKNSGFEMKPKKIVINLAPANVPKKGSLYDLPIALTIICAYLNIQLPRDALFFGELSLDGSLRYTPGSFLLGLYAKDLNVKNIFIPKSCLPQLSTFKSLNVYGLTNVFELIEYLKGDSVLLPSVIRDAEKSDGFEKPIIMDHVLGQSLGKRGVIISASGGHHLMFQGPPGSGKSMLSKVYKNLLPDLSDVDSLEVTKIHSIKNYLSKDIGLVSSPPFRSPHHTVSYAGMLGGGNNPTPGEISLAHKGILFMDEFNEFSRRVIEGLRQPLEDKQISITRKDFFYTFPCDFRLLAACNPCPCGYHGHPNKECSCSFGDLQRYNRKLSGPILDRIDLFIKVDPVEVELLGLSPSSSNLEHLQAKDLINSVVTLQKQRYKDTTICNNAMLTSFDIEKYCKLDDMAKVLLKSIAKSMSFSARAYYKVIKVAQTIADLEFSDEIKDYHVAEAIKYRN